MKLLTAHELCDTLRISRSTLHRLKKAGLPAISGGRLTRFDPDKVLGWFAQYSPQTTPAITLLPPGDYRCKTCSFQGTIDRAFLPDEVSACPKCGTLARPIRVDAPA